MSRPTCLQCRRHRALSYAEVTISDGRLTYWHHPRVCSWCLLVLSGTMEAFEPEIAQPALLAPLTLRSLAAK